MIHHKFQPKEQNGKRVRPAVTIPDQSLTIPEILQRFTRNLPVNLKQSQPVWSTQTEFDLEALGRMDFHEKAEFAAQMAERAKEIKAALDEQAARQRKAQEEKLAERLEQRSQAVAAAKAAAQAQKPGTGE